MFNIGKIDMSFKKYLKFSNIIKILLIFNLFTVLIYGQGRKYSGPDDPAGDQSGKRVGYMSGNRVYLFFRNTTEISNCCGTLYSRWPNNDDMQPMTDGIALLIGSRLYVEKDTIPVTDKTKIKNGTGLDTIYFLQTSYREETDMDPTGSIEWGFAPVHGYFNESNDYIAMSHISSSWPEKGWPAPNDQLKWAGEWNGRFGRGVFNAEQESYFVANDAQDQEYLQKSRKSRYYPKPGVKIGDKGSPYITTQIGAPWGGMGLRVEQRGFQWNNPQSKDAVFWEYSIANISNYDINEVCFGYWMDNGIGGNDPYDDLAFYVKNGMNMAYSWDRDGVGNGGGKTGTQGFAFLESPSLSYDGIDNDADGLTDEKRDNQPTAIVGPKAGITDMTNYLKHYGKTEAELKSHWDADEDQDWTDGIDLNNNGKYDSDEDAGDDLGLDGVGPADLNYTGPDADGTECNHKPDFVEGLGCEPNFAFVDIDESDMIGLTTFRMFQVPPHTSEKGWSKDDEGMFKMMSSNDFIEWLGETTNLVEFFAAGIFPLYKGLTERISMALLYAYDPLDGLNSTTHSAPLLFRSKEVVQAIYQTDYRFAMPPIMPTLTATPGDGKVILSWDDLSDTRTHDPFVKNVNDFEGFKLYRATDKYFQDCEVITDGYGTPMFKKPLYECDIKDGKTGFTNFGMVNGMGYYLGSDKGITHYYVDNNVNNGQTYYYGLVAYDYGLSDVGGGITPSENTLIVDLDEYDNIRKLSRNVKVVTPHQTAIGYISPNITFPDEKKKNINGTAISAVVVDNSAIKADHLYKVKFEVTPIQYLRDGQNTFHPNDRWYATTGYSIYDVTAKKDSLVYYETQKRYFGDNLAYHFVETQVTIYDKVKLEYYCFNEKQPVTSDIVDGVQLSFNQPRIYPEFDSVNSGWLVGSTPISVKASGEGTQYFPWDYNIVFIDTQYKSRVTLTSLLADVEDHTISSSNLLLKQSFNFYVENRTFKLSDGTYEKLDLVIYDRDGNGSYEPDSDYVLAGHVVQSGSKVRWSGTVFGLRFPEWNKNSLRPKKGDLYQIRFKRPLMENDSFFYKVNPAKEKVQTEINNGMEKIKVVPNPYIATNMMEPAVVNQSLNQKRRIMFTHVPAQSTIKIFTMSGVFVNQIDVDNASDNGSVHWDLLTKEGLELAAGVYIYHVKSKVTGAEKIGKFSVIK